MKTDVVTCRRRDNNNLQPVNLLPLDRRRTRRVDVRSVNLALTALLATLLVAAITIPIVQKNHAIVEIEAQVQAAAAEARQGAELRQDLEKMAAALSTRSAASCRTTPGSQGSTCPDPSCRSRGSRRRHRR
jgi:hypothetical protein